MLLSKRRRACRAHARRPHLVEITHDDRPCAGDVFGIAGVLQLEHPRAFVMRGQARREHLRKMESGSSGAIF